MIATVEVIEGGQVRHSTWKAEIDAGKVNQFDPGSVRILFGSSAGLDISKPTVSPDLPREMLAAVTKDLNGLFGNRINGNWDEIWYTFKIKQVTNNPNKISYHWDQVTAFSRWDASNNAGVFLCLDCPNHTKETLKSLWQSQNFNLLSLHAEFLDATKDLYDQSVWSLRDCVRAAEHARDNIPNFLPDFILLHEIARHITHSDETLDVTIELIECIREVLKEKSNGVEDRNAENKMRALQMQIRALSRRSTSLKERLQNEINLAFNLVTQRDSKIMVDLGDNSRKDSNNMKSIAVVGLVYLPGTFISGLFGMNFFDFDASANEQIWRVSDKFWMYWAITIPVTFFTVLVWVVMFHSKAFERTVVRPLVKHLK